MARRPGPCGRGAEARSRRRPPSVGLLLPILLVATGGATAADPQTTLSAFSTDVEELVGNTRGGTVTVIASDHDRLGGSLLGGIWFQAPGCRICVITAEELTGDQFRVQDGPDRTLIARVRARGQGITVLEIAAAPRAQQEAEAATPRAQQEAEAAAPRAEREGAGSDGPLRPPIACCGEFRRGRVVVAVGPARVTLGILERPADGDPGRAQGEQIWFLSSETSGIDRSSVVVDDKGMLMGLTAPAGERAPAAPPASRPSVARRGSPRVEVLSARELFVAANEMLADQPRSALDGRPALGVMLQEVDPALGLHLRLGAGRGVQVTRIAENGPARRAGIRVHDVIVRGNGVEFAGLGSFLEWFDARKRREEVTLEIYQAGRPRTIRVRLD
jgi:hypothetical protein